jgi:hypothetical protein
MLVTMLVYAITMADMPVSGPSTMVMNSAEACEMASRSILNSQNTKTLESYGFKVTATCSTK